MYPETEGTRVELDAADAEIAMHAYEAHGYRIIGLKYDGAYAPEREVDGRLVVDVLGASALKACLFENVKYNLDFLYGKWVDYPEGSVFKPGYIQKHLSQQKLLPSSERLERMHSIVDEVKAKLRNSQRVNVILSEFLEQEAAAEASEEDAA